MRRRINILLATLLFAALTALLGLSFKELISIKEFLITHQPEAKEIIDVENISFLLAVGGVVGMLMFVITLRLLLKKQNVVVEYIEKEQGNLVGQEDDSLEQNLNEEKRIQEKAEQILEGIEADSASTLGENFLIKLSKEYEIAQGIIYTKGKDNDIFTLSSSYAFYTADDSVRTFKYGHGLPGQVAMNKELLNLKNVPKKYLTIMSGLGNSSPKHLMIFPLVIEGTTVAVVELASFSTFNKESEKVLQLCAEKISEKHPDLFPFEKDETVVIEE